jgi:hypothetical protein
MGYLSDERAIRAAIDRLCVHGHTHGGVSGSGTRTARCSASAVPAPRSSDVPREQSLAPARSPAHNPHGCSSIPTSAGSRGIRLTPSHGPAGPEAASPSCQPRNRESSGNGAPRGATDAPLSRPAGSPVAVARSAIDQVIERRLRAVGWCSLRSTVGVGWLRSRSPISRAVDRAERSAVADWPTALRAVRGVYADGELAAARTASEIRCWRGSPCDKAPRISTYAIWRFTQTHLRAGLPARSQRVTSVEMERRSGFWLRCAREGSRSRAPRLHHGPACTCTRARRRRTFDLRPVDLPVRFRPARRILFA